MSGDVKFEIKVDSRGGDNSAKDIGKVGKSIADLSEQAKQNTRQMAAMRDATKAAVGDLLAIAKASKDAELIFKQMAAAEQALGNNIKATNRELQARVQLMANGRVTSGGPGNVGVGGSGGSNSGNGANYNGPVSGGSGGGGINWGKIGGIAMGAANLANAGFGMYGQYLQHSGRHMTEDKLMGAQNLVRAQGYRNHMYNEAMDSPIGWVARKNTFQMSLRNRDSAPTQVDENGRLLASQAGAVRSETGASLTSAAANMSGANREISGEKVSALSQGIAGALKIAAGGGAGFMVGGPVGALVGAGMAASSGGGGADLMNAYFGNKRADRKLATGELEGQQSEEAIKASRLVDALMHIEQRQVQTFENQAVERMSLNRHSLGGASWAMGSSYGGFSNSEINGVIGDLRRGYGGAAGNEQTVGAVMRAGRSGMGLGVGSHIVGASEAVGDSGATNLKRIFAAGITEGMTKLDMGFFEKMGTAFANELYSPTNGVRDSNAIGAMLFNGVGTNVHKMDENIRGLTMGDKIKEGNNALSSEGLVNAINILGKDGREVNYGEAAALNNASMKDLAGGGSKTLRAMLKAGGLNDEQVTAAIKEQRESNVDVIGSKIGGPFGERIAAAGGLNNFLKQKLTDEDRAALSGWTGITFGEKDTGGLQGWGRNVGAGDGSSFKKGRAHPGSVVRGTDAKAIDLKRKRDYTEGVAGEETFASPRTRTAALNQLLAEGDEVVPAMPASNGLPAVDAVRAPKPYDQALYDRIMDGTASKTEVMAVTERANVAQGNKAKGASDGYDGSQELISGMTTLVNEIRNLIKVMH